jgi:hypothetical protein
MLLKAIAAQIEADKNTGAIFDPAGGFNGGEWGESGRLGALDYGSILDGIKGLSGGGSLDVHLGGSAGTTVPGVVFNGLKKKSGASVVFSQTGASVAFKAGDVGSVKDADLFDLGFSPSAPSGAYMAGAAGDGQSFVYSFAHAGKMPGYGTFSISTGIAEGSTVNVYRFDAGTGKFAQIAGGLKVGAGGVVTYRNDTASQYLITTSAIAGAAKSSAFARQGGGVWLPGQWWFWALIALVAAGGGFALWKFAFRRRKSSAA